MQMNSTVIYKTNCYDDAINISVSLRNEGSVIVDARNAEEETAKKIIDFVSGAAYATGGYMAELDNNLVVFSKDHIIDSD